jgi:antitoxin (DNA-binding transcriptional repressor) of toxin-antitoxin stability system
MGELVAEIKLSDARSKLTQLDKLLKPGEALKITKRGKAFARIELLGEMDQYDIVLRSIEALPEPEENLRPIAQNYKSIVYGNNNEYPQRI